MDHKGSRTLSLLKRCLRNKTIFFLLCPSPQNRRQLSCSWRVYSGPLHPFGEEIKTNFLKYASSRANRGNREVFWEPCGWARDLKIAGEIAFRQKEHHLWVLRRHDGTRSAVQWNSRKSSPETKLTSVQHTLLYPFAECLRWSWWPRVTSPHLWKEYI